MGNLSVWNTVCPSQFNEGNEISNYSYPHNRTRRVRCAAPDGYDTPYPTGATLRYRGTFLDDVPPSQHFGVRTR
ncbi:MAG: hypothetical protein IJR02_00870 [Bacteroidaceae bacterium]|nr:hypothetical protein [Bacteroidaceae bacterium]